ncbi:hypothetical protein AWW66_06370 [Micromonospora rosaria]|uniref:VTT domain-containing protein n=1 Tax=Micromonospora rosaria TaxID=47874 RepID=A0A136PWT0_9ACTN|nr:DedA family protein [Micromonospora rosaria]KXK62807.1 hypothetical protein AWW66_06370 [Micromonospora rosaria]
MDRLLTLLAGLPPLAVLTVVLVLPALESSTLVGLVVPGEAAVLVGGVAAHAGGVPLGAVIGAATVGAFLGDQVGYLVGRRFGPAALAHGPRFLRRRADLGRARRLLTRWGALAVLLGRWVAVLRTVVPLVAGASGMPRTSFTWANLVGGTLWATGVSLVGYLGAASWRYLDQRLGVAQLALFGLVVLGVLLVSWYRRRHR